MEKFRQVSRGGCGNDTKTKTSTFVFDPLFNGEPVQFLQERRTGLFEVSSVCQLAQFLHFAKIVAYVSKLMS